MAAIRDGGAVRDEPEWVEHAIWWQVYPLGFLGADVTGADRTARRSLRDLIPWLDYAVRLGCSGILLGPIFESGTHGYDTVDYFRIDSRLGDRGDFDALVAAARDRGLRIALDGVFNHVGRGFVRFTEPGWLRAVPGSSGGYEVFEGHQTLVALDHDSPQVQDLVVDVMAHWLDAGASAWRLDAAYAVRPAFWAQVAPRVRAAHPDAYLFGEVLHGDYAGYVEPSGLDSVTQYELWKAIWSSILDVNFFELAWALKRHNELLGSFAPLTFAGNHDVTRLASRIDDARHLPHAIVVLLAVGGTPSIYAGDEQGFVGVKEDRAGGDDAVRPEFPAEPGQLSELGWPIYRLHQRLTGLRRRHPWLHRARLETVSLANAQFAFRLVDPAGSGAALRVGLNLADDPMTIAGGGSPVLGDAAAGADGWVIGPHGWAVLAG
jgi:cyclomaltodextrinase